MFHHFVGLALKGLNELCFVMMIVTGAIEKSFLLAIRKSIVIGVSVQLCKI